MFKTNILLINPIIRASKPAFHFPLGLGYIASILLGQGHDLDILDINAHRWDDEIVKWKIEKCKPDAIGISALITDYSQIKELSKTVKNIHKDVNIILGGGLATAMPELVLKKTDVDINIIGEGEITSVELFDKIERGKSIDKVKGIVFKEKGIIKQTEQRKQIENLDEIPFPARELFPMNKYIQSSYLKLFDDKVRSTQIITSRGCPYNCSYCFKGMWGHNYRKRSVDNVIDEIKHLIEKYNVNGLQIVDDTFVLDKKRIHEICDKMIEEKLDLIWTANGRVNLMDKELLEKMHKAGCKVVCYGIESGSQKVLDKMKKGITVKQAEKAIQETWKAGILPHGYLMMGMIGETKESINETVKFCNKNALVGQFSFVTPIPKTELYEKSKSIGKLKHDEEWLLENWGEWNDKMLVNLTDMPEKEMIKLKKRSERKMLYGNLPYKFWKHWKIIKTKNLVREGVCKVKEWGFKKYGGV